MAEDLVASGAVESVDGYRLTHEGVKWPGAVDSTSTIFRYPSSEGDVFTLHQEHGEYQIQYGALDADGSIIWRPDGYQVPARPYTKTFTMPAGTAYVAVSWQRSKKSVPPTLVKVSGGGGSMSVLSSAQVTLAWSAGILATVRYYQLAAPTAATPTVPTSSDALGSWSETEPTADVTKVLWTCERTVYADGTESWSKASKSTSYEAAKDAKSTATDAQNKAQEVEERVEVVNTNLETTSKDILATIDTRVTTVQTDVDTNAENVNDLNSRLTDEIKARQSFMRFSEESSDPTLTLGQTDSPAQVKLTNKQLQFLYLSSVVAYMSGDALLINNAKILQQLQLGGFSFVPRGNGNLAFKWVGGDS